MCSFVILRTAVTLWMAQRQFIRQPDALAVATSELVATPVRLDKGSAQENLRHPK